MTKLLMLLFLPAVVLGAPELSAASPLDPMAFGAKGDGIADDSGAINAAIAAAAEAGGGTVFMPAGRYLSGSIHLRSHVELHLGPGAVIVGTADGSAYDKPEPNSWGDSLHYQDSGHSHWHNSLIWGENLVDVSITGPGTIYGRGLDRGWDSEQQGQKIGNKAVALRDCRNVTLRGFTIRHGGWFGILATGVDNLVIDSLTIDTNRDGMDIDCCHNVRVSGCSVNSPWDDGICLKSSFGLGRFRTTENVTISDCLVSGYDEGTLLDGTRTHDAKANPAPTGRIKFGTESNGGFVAVAVSNCLFECCRGLALESVDGARLEDVSVTNLAMHRIFGAPIFLRLGERMRGPAGTAVGILRRVEIGNVTAEDVEMGQGILLTGLSGHPIEEVTLHDIRMEFEGGGTAQQATRTVPELEREYPEPGNFGPTNAWAIFARHVKDLSVHHVSFRASAPDQRPSVFFDDVHGASLDHVAAAAQGGPPFASRGSANISTESFAGMPDTARP